jgi:hypothetical protein
MVQCQNLAILRPIKVQIRQGNDKVSFLRTGQHGWDFLFDLHLLPLLNIEMCCFEFSRPVPIPVFVLGIFSGLFLRLDTRRRIRDDLQLFVLL